VGGGSCTPWSEEEATVNLNVLLLEGERGAAIAAERDLAAAGHTVHRCRPADGPAFPCAALADDGCPLDRAVVDVALDVRRRTHDRPSAREDGVVCALRRRIPLVVAGSAADNPYVDAVEVVEPAGDVVSACERAAVAPLVRQAAAASEALVQVLERRMIASVPSVAVRRVRGRLVVEVDGAATLDTATRSMAAVRMTGAVRRVDRSALGIDVVFDGA